MEASGWSLASSAGQRARAYVAALFSGMLNTLGLENGFNDLRDNEARGARHKQRAAETIQALSISSQHSRYSEQEVGLVDLPPEVVSQFGSLHCTKELFDPTAVPNTRAALGFDAGDFDGCTWTSNHVAEFPRVQLSLLNGLLTSPKENWANLWMASLLRPGMLVSNKATGAGSYVVSADKYTVVLLDLAGSGAKFLLGESTVLGSGPLRPQTVTALDQFWCHDCALGLDDGEDGDVVLFTSDQTFSMAEYCARRWAHLLPLALLKRALKELAVVTKGVRNRVGFVTALLDHCGVHDGDRDAMLSLIEAQTRRRAKKAAPAADGGEDEAAWEEAPDVAPPSVLAELCPDEISYVCTGTVAAGAALMEEETDAGLDFMAAGQPTRPPPPTRGRLRHHPPAPLRRHRLPPVRLAPLRRHRHRLPRVRPAPTWPSLQPSPTATTSLWPRP